MSLSNPFDRQERLTPRDVWYANILSDFWEMQLKWDGFDLTTATLLGEENPVAKAKIFAKSKGVLAGQEEIEYVLNQEVGLEVAFLKHDGEELLAGEKVLEIWGDAQTLLKIERTLVNFLSRLSGIATLSRNVVKMIPKGVMLCATRKTLWGPLDKKGVVVGNAFTHRVNLADAILIKENHITLVNGSFKTISDKITAEKDIGAFWEVEVESKQEFYNLLNHLPKQRPGIVMFDNFSAKDVKSLMASVEKPEGIYYEVSGGISPRNIVEYAKTGCDAVSAGFITNAVSPVDFSMQLTIAKD